MINKDSHSAMDEKMEKPTRHLKGRLQEEQASILQRIGVSIQFDKELYTQDIRASIAHAKMLHKIGVLTKEELDSIIHGLHQIESEIRDGKFEFRVDLEDIHMHIENRLIELIGNPGKKLHTARSRNDQVAQDERLYILDSIEQIQNKLLELLETLVNKADQLKDSIFPGYTHLQIAQPIYASHYLMAHFWAFLRDLEFFEYVSNTSNELVLGSGALAGVNYTSDREFLKNELGLKNISQNSVDAVSQRDYFLQFLMACSQTMIHASRFAEEIVLYSSIEFSYIQLPDKLTTGSSIMPQKKNPDIAELIRGKSGMVVGDLMSLLVLMKGTPLAYNRDFQEDKQPVFRTVNHILLSLEGLKDLVGEMVFQNESIEKNLRKGFATATDLADYLVNEKNLPFREAHELTGKLVSLCIERGEDLFSIPEEQRKEISIHFVGDGYFKAIDLKNSANKKNVWGGTSFQDQIRQINAAIHEIKKWKKKLQK